MLICKQNMQQQKKKKMKRHTHCLVQLSLRMAGRLGIFHLLHVMLVHEGFYYFDHLLQKNAIYKARNPKKTMITCTQFWHLILWNIVKILDYQFYILQEVASKCRRNIECKMQKLTVLEVRACGRGKAVQLSIP